MKSLQDAIYNWLTIKVVSDARPDDTAAKDTSDLFLEILTNEHHLSGIEVTTDETFYYVSYLLDGESQKKRFPIEVIEFFLEQINKEPEKYENYPLEDE